jgi:anthranilate phosphoribosyltransferase
LGIERALVVCGEDGLDEVTLHGATRATEAVRDATREFTWTPADFGFEPTSLERLRVDGPVESAAMIRDVLAGKPGAARNIVVMNAAAALWTARYAETPLACARQAAEVINTGAARELLSRLVELTNRR